MRQYLTRCARMLLGLAVSAVGVVMTLKANIGLDPWNILHQGLAMVTGVSFGAATVIVGTAIIIISVLMGERIGLSTVANITICGPIIDCILALDLIPTQTSFLPGLLLLLAGLETLTIGTWLYMSAGLGSGPRDAVNVVLARKTRIPVGVCRSAIELLVTLTGWLLGGQLGVGTVLAAVGIGFFFQVNFTLLHFDPAGLPQENLLQTLRIVRGALHKKKAEDEAVQ